MNTFLAQWLYQLDLFVLRLINVTYSGPVLDQVWLQLSHLQRQAWFIFLALPGLLIWLVYIYRARIVKPLVALLITVSLSDLFAYRIVKFWVNRPRPLQNPEIASWLRRVGEAHGPSFPSNHAANCFAGAAILAWYFPSVRILVYILATLVALSRIGLGVHYPSDVLAGAILGIIVGFLCKTLIFQQIKWFRMKPPVPKLDLNFQHWRIRSRRIDQD